MKTRRIFTTNLSVEESSARAAATLRALNATDLKRAPNCQPVRGFVPHDGGSHQVDIWSIHKNGGTEVEIEAFSSGEGGNLVFVSGKWISAFELVADKVERHFRMPVAPTMLELQLQDNVGMPWFWHWFVAIVLLLFGSAFVLRIVLLP